MDLSVSPRRIDVPRRRFLQTISAAGLIAAGLPFAAYSRDEQDPWNSAQSIIDRLAAPTSFPSHDFPIGAYGAKPCAVRSVLAWVSHDHQGMTATPVADAADCYPAISAAIQACHAAGGGRVVVPAGDWFCAGPIVLLSNVHVHLESGAHVYFSTNPIDYAKYGSVDCGANGRLEPTRWQSNDCLNFSPLVYAWGQHNIALTGADWTSVLDGQGGVLRTDSDQCWWSWKGISGKTSQQHDTENTVNPLNPTSLVLVTPDLPAPQISLIEGNNQHWRTDFGYLSALSEAGVPPEKRVFGLGHYLRPPMIQLIGCSNVLLQGYQTTNTPFWQHHPVNCRDLVIRNVYVNSLGPNSDGIDPDACDGVLIEGCVFNTGDDCIAIKAGKNRDFGYGPTKNIVIQHCTMQSGHGAITLGSEMSGGIEYVYAQYLRFENINWKTNSLNTGLRLKTNMNRGGYLRHFYVRDVAIPNGVSTTPKFYRPLNIIANQSTQVATVSGAIITIDCDYSPQEDNVRIRAPLVSDIHISGVTVGNVESDNGLHSAYQALVIQGPVSANYNGTDKNLKVEPVTNVTISDCNFGSVINAKQPFYLFNAKDIRFTNVTIGADQFNQIFNALP